MEKYWRTVGERLVNMIKPSVFANWNLLKLGSYLPHRDWETDTLSFLKIVSQGKEAGRCSTSQRGRERIYNGKFSKVNALKKEVRVYSQEEGSLKFSQASGNMKDAIANGC